VKIDTIFWFCLRHCNEVAVGMHQREPGYTDQILDKWATHLVCEIRNLHEGGGAALMRLPQA
jgi:hypothetical protein